MSQTSTREILFRAIPVGGKNFRYGHYYYDPCANKHMLVSHECDDSIGIHFEVIGDTVGQFTGIFDTSKEDECPTELRYYCPEDFWRGIPLFCGDIVEVKVLADEDDSGACLGVDEIYFSNGRFYVKGWASLYDIYNINLKYKGNIHTDRRGYNG